MSNHDITELAQRVRAPDVELKNLRNDQTAVLARVMIQTLNLKLSIRSANRVPDTGGGMAYDRESWDERAERSGRAVLHGGAQVEPRQAYSRASLG